MSLAARMRGYKRQVIEDTLRETGGNRAHAAQILALNRTHLQALIRQLGITVPVRSRPRSLDETES